VNEGKRDRERSKNRIMVTYDVYSCITRITTYKRNKKSLSIAIEEIKGKAKTGNNLCDTYECLCVSVWKRK
jgi:hypothetical protein